MIWNAPESSINQEALRFNTDVVYEIGLCYNELQLNYWNELV